MASGLVVNKDIRLPWSNIHKRETMMIASWIFSETNPLLLLLGTEGHFVLFQLCMCWDGWLDHGGIRKLSNSWSRRCLMERPVVLFVICCIPSNTWEKLCAPYPWSQAAQYYLELSFEIYMSQSRVSGDSTFLQGSFENPWIFSIVLPIISSHNRAWNTVCVLGLWCWVYDKMACSK